MNWKKWMEKTSLYLIYAALTGAISMLTGDVEWVVLMPFLMSLQNLLKHKLGMFGNGR